MNFLLIQAQAQAQTAGWEKWIGEGVAITLILMLLGFILRLAPMWKDIKLREFDVRTKEAEASGQVSFALTQSANAQNQLATALGTLGETIKDIAIEQKKATDNVMILQRVNSNESNQISDSVEELIERMDTLEEVLKEKDNEIRPKTTTQARN